MRRRLKKAWAVYRQISAIRSLLQWLGLWTYFVAASSAVLAFMLHMVAHLPWPLSVVLGIVCFYFLGVGVAMWRVGVFGSGSVGIPIPPPPLNEKRQNLISNWRAMVTEVHYQSECAGDYHRVIALLERHPTFPTIRQYLSEKSKRAMGGRYFIVAPPGSSMNGLLRSILDDIERIEEEWDL